MPRHISNDVWENCGIKQEDPYGQTWTEGGINNSVRGNAEMLKPEKEYNASTRPQLRPRNGEDENVC